ncbi:ricin B-like lectin [Crassisporium funariophilum]|nr:ricin B-like lectin [Crassisporium funariophilum]
MSVTIESTHRYIIKNQKGGTVIDLNGNDNRSIIGFPRHGGPNQQWETIRTADGWHIKNVATGLYLSFEGQAGDGKKLVADQAPFLWHLWPDKKQTDAFRICVPNTKQNVDLSDHGNPNPGTPVTLWGTWEGLNQVWLFERV